ncbi:hypothetical protein [Paraburkholderia sp.]|uniref:GntT/GntP/DsdX family permease n=1 Tax=Paraburkholderia sp. TaxID=1926495 RepID=UPI003D6E6A11
MHRKHSLCCRRLDSPAVTLLLGLVVGLPAAVLAGSVYGIWLARSMPVGARAEMGEVFGRQSERPAQPGFPLSLVTIQLPVADAGAHDR